MLKDNLRRTNDYASTARYHTVVEANCNCYAAVSGAGISIDGDLRGVLMDPSPEGSGACLNFEGGDRSRNSPLFFFWNHLLFLKNNNPEVFF